MTQWLTGEIGRIQTLVFGAMTLVAIVAVAGVYWRTKALVPVLVSMLTAGVVLWGVHNTSWLSSRVGSETSTSAPAKVGHTGPAGLKVTSAGARYRVILARAA